MLGIRYPVKIWTSSRVVKARRTGLRHLEERTRTFRRVSHMMDHVENLHLRKQPAKQRLICHHPMCKAEGLVLNHVMHFKNHVARVHRINLRPGVFPY